MSVSARSTTPPRSSDLKSDNRRPASRRYRYPASRRHRYITRLLPRAASCLILLLLAAHAGLAQPSPASTTIPALFLSDIHLDPYADPTIVPRLNDAPVSGWAAILAAPASADRDAAAQALAKACPARGTDTPDRLWRSALDAIHRDAAHATFVTVSGDLLAHKFDCKFHTLLPHASQADYVAFAAKTVAYVVTSLRQALPGIPVYVTMGNNDSGCTDYALAPTQDAFLERVAPIVADALPAADRASVLRDFAAGGNYNVPLAGVPHTRLIALDDLYLSTKYVTCDGTPDPAPAEAHLRWLKAQLEQARAAHDHVWLLAHIPPGVDIYSSGKKIAIGLGCTRTPVMFLASDALGSLIAAYPDTIALGLFGHTHNDELRLLTPSATGSAPDSPPTRSGQPGVPLKLVASITPINGNLPTFTLAKISPATATLADYTVYVSSALQGGASALWTPEYTFSTTYAQPAFTASALAQIIAGFQNDPQAAQPASAAYLRYFFPGDLSAVVKMAWPQYACTLDHQSAEAYAACSCKGNAQ